MKKSIRLILFLALFLITSSKSQSLLAASIEISSGSNCAIELHGKITEGDALKLVDVLGEIDIRSGMTSEPEVDQRKICLNSSGGNYIEGRILSEIIHEYGLTTLVDSGSKCYSSCAFMFMAGRVNWTEGEGPSRILHVNGSLGFHAPYFNLSEGGSISSGDALELIKLMNLVISDFIEFGAHRSMTQSKRSFSTSLLGKVLSTNRNELIIIDDIEGIARWDIDIEGNIKEANLDDIHLYQACANYLKWLYDEESDKVQSESISFGFPKYYQKKMYGRETTLVRFDFGGMAERGCDISKADQPVSGVTICTYDGFNGVSIGKCEEGWGDYIPWYYALPPETKLSQIAERSSMIAPIPVRRPILK